MTIAIRDAFIKISTSPWTPLLKDHAFLSDTSDEMPHIELKKGLRLTHPIPKSYNVKGYCMGGALTLISCYLHRQAPLDIKQLHHDYRIAIKSVIIVWKNPHVNWIVSFVKPTLPVVQSSEASK